MFIGVQKTLLRYLHFRCSNFEKSKWKCGNTFKLAEKHVNSGNGCKGIQNVFNPENWGINLIRYYFLTCELFYRINAVPNAAAF